MGSCRLLSTLVITLLLIPRLQGSVVNKSETSMNTLRYWLRNKVLHDLLISEGCLEDKLLREKRDISMNSRSEILRDVELKFYDYLIWSIDGMSTRKEDYDCLYQSRNSSNYQNKIYPVSNSKYHLSTTTSSENLNTNYYNWSIKSNNTHCINIHLFDNYYASMQTTKWVTFMKVFYIYFTLNTKMLSSEILQAFGCSRWIGLFFFSSCTLLSLH